MNIKLYLKYENNDINQNKSLIKEIEMYEKHRNTKNTNIIQTFQIYLNLNLNIFT